MSKFGYKSPVDYYSPYHNVSNPILYKDKIYFPRDDNELNYFINNVNTCINKNVLPIDVNIKYNIVILG